MAVGGNYSQRTENFEVQRRKYFQFCVDTAFEGNFYFLSHHTTVNIVISSNCYYVKTQ